MYFCFMIVVTGAAGFIGSCLVSKLNSLGFEDLILVDDFSSFHKNNNIEGKKYNRKIERLLFIDWFSRNALKIDFVYHIGARTDTAEFDVLVFDELNLNYSKSLWNICSRNKIPFVYASSAATYGMGELGFEDNHKIVKKLQPLNPYAKSKNDFDKWVLSQDNQASFWAGLKFFNVFGPNEFHKRRMTSVVFNSANQIRMTGKMKLFRSHNPMYKDGEQARDFVYVKDVVEVLIFMMETASLSGIYNLGSGVARSFYDLVLTTFSVMNIKPNILFIDTPEDIRDKYQYFTKANMQKLRSAGYKKPFTTLEDGIEDYLNNYLLEKNYY